MGREQSLQRGLGVLAWAASGAGVLGVVLAFAWLGEASAWAQDAPAVSGRIRLVVDPQRGREAAGERSERAGQVAPSDEPRRPRDEPQAEPAVPKRQRDRGAGPDRQRDRDAPREAGPRAQSPHRPDREPEGEPEGMPATRIAPPELPEVPPRPRPARWILGVHAYNTDTGVVITRVQPGSPAWREGLERGDVIVTVDGYQVGYVDGYVYYLGDELQKRADREGRVLLLVQNVRDRRLLNLEVRLQRNRW